MNRFGAQKRSGSYQLAGPSKRNRVSGPIADWLDLPTHLPNTLSSSVSCATSIDELASSQCTTNEINDTVELQPAPLDVISGLSANSQITDDKDIAAKVKILEPSSSRATEPIYIEGTTISLQTDEDIAKWIEERKKNWPTRKNIAAKAERQQALAPAQPTKEVKLNKQVCRFFAKSGRCKFGNKCKNSHESALEPGTRMINGLSVKVPQRFKNNPAKGSLFKNLVQKDYFENENNVVLDFIQYLLSESLIDLNACP